MASVEVAFDQTFARVRYGEPGVSTPGFSAEVHWLLTDHLNSVRLVLDEGGAVLDQIAYDAFGNIVARLHPTTGVVGSLFDNPILFTSREFDAETGLYYNRARYLDPTTGRWTTQDPLGFAAGDANLYRYVSNMATMATDPSGQIAWVPIIAAVVIIAGVSGGVTGYVTGEGPSTAGSFIPGWGAGRSAGAHFSRGNYWRGTGYTALAVSDVFLVRSVATNFARVGLRGSVPGTMSVYRETGLYRFSGEPTVHYFWSVSGRQPYPYYHAINTVHNGRVGVFVLGSETAGLGGHQFSRIFWSPVLNTGMAGIGRHGYPAINCFTACASAWSAGNYHLVPYIGLHGPAIIWLPE